MEVDNYVTYNYRENHWSVGNMVRTIGVDNTVFPTPLRVGANSALYEHEVGFAYENTAPFARTGPVEINGGEVVHMAKYLYPDERTQGQVQARFATRFYPNSTEYPFGPYSMTNPTSIRFTGRQVAAQVEAMSVVKTLADFAANSSGDLLLTAAVSATDFRVGNLRMDVEAGGMR
jgi:hypothetical protein